eukprot:scaffold2778_cov168-Amphora_coffeaeformis.AAC.7
MITFAKRQWKGISQLGLRCHSPYPARHPHGLPPTRLCVTSKPEVAPFPSDTTVVLWTTVPVSPQASAAGVRTLGILKQLLTNSPGITSVHVVAPSLPKEQSASPSTADEALLQTVQQLERQGVHFHVVQPNREDDTRDFLHSLPQRANIMCLFDRFYAEEIYSHHVHRHSPHATLVLDMQDMHSLRRARQRAVQTAEGDCLLGGITAAQATIPDAHDNDLLRELASIHRMDLTLVCSPHEMNLLVTHYGIAPEKLMLAPLLGNSIQAPNAMPSWSHRQDVCFVGGFRHDPNVDAVDQLLRLWPHIRQQLNERGSEKELPRLHIYGAFLTSTLRQKWHAKLRRATSMPDLEYCGISLDGFVSDLRHVLLGHRLMLAPLRFGAGLKGKFVEAWQSGLPVVTTPIGAEGFFHLETLHSFPGRVASSDEAFVKAVLDLYTNESAWNQAQEHTRAAADVSDSTAIVGDLQNHRSENQDDTLCWKRWIDIAAPWPDIVARFFGTMETLSERRKKDTTRAILWRETLRSTEFFSKYIEQKELHRRK